MKGLHMVAFVLLVIGGLNLGLASVGFDVVNMVLGNWPAVVQILYVLIGVSAILEVVTHKSNCNNCMASGQGNA